MKPSKKAIKVRFIIGNDGSVQANIVEHLNGSKCNDKVGGRNINEKFMQDLLDMNIDGFGSTELTDGGMTAEGRAQEETPIVTPPQEGKKVKPKGFGTEEKLQQGYGV